MSNDDSQLYTFEIAMEVANKVGGIYTVLRTKASVTVEELGEDYCMIGIANDKFVQMEVEKMEFTEPALLNSVNEMRNRGIDVVSGRWLIEGYPKVVLFNLNSAYGYLNEWRSELFDKLRIGIPDHDSECHRVVLFGFLTTWFLGLFRSNCGEKPVVIAHFHEWLAGVGLLLCHVRKIDISTIFTTHATLLGRYLCAANVDFYNNLDKFEIDKEAGNREIYHRYCLERAAVHTCNVFTTVSAVTALEAQHLLKRNPDLILPNGLSISNTQCLHEFQNLHAISKEKINTFIRGHFYGHFDFDLDNTLYFFTAGRYEYSNKGADVFIESLARLNHKLKAHRKKTTVVAFLIFPAATNNFNVESLKGQAVVKQLRETVDHIKNDIGHRIFDTCLTGVLPGSEQLLEKDEIIKLKRCMYSNTRDQLPPIVTHNMCDNENDPILNQIRRVQLFNKKSDRVKVIFHPEFLQQTSALLPMDYEDFVRGCHLGVFPSYYEPWGYTPAECTVMGIPNVSTNLSGFGCFMESHIKDPEAYGIYIVDRRYQAGDQSCAQLADYMFQFTCMNRRERIIQRNRTERLSELLDWGRLGMYYSNARRLAIERTHPEFLESEQLFGSPGVSMRLSRPMSAATSPYTSRTTSPHQSLYDEDEDEVVKLRNFEDDDSGLHCTINHSTDTESILSSSSHQANGLSPTDINTLSKLNIK